MIRQQIQGAKLKRQYAYIERLLAQRGNADYLFLDEIPKADILGNSWKI